MAGARLTFEERKSILKWHIKFENVAEVQRQWKREFQTQSPTRLTITRLCDKFNNNNNNNNNIYLLQLGCYPVAVVILHVNKHEIGYY